MQAILLVSDSYRKGLTHVVVSASNLSGQVRFANQMIFLMQNTPQEADFALLRVYRRLNSFLRFYGNTALRWR